MSRLDAMLEQDFGTLSDMVRVHADEQPDHLAVQDDETALSYSAFNAMIDRIAASLQRDGLGKGDVVAICASASVQYVAVFFGALRAGLAVTPLAPSSTPESLKLMVEDAGSRILFCDASTLDVTALVPAGEGLARLRLDGTGAGTLAAWLAPEGSVPKPVVVEPKDPFNIIYSSGTTGTPKGIVQPHRMRWLHVWRGRLFGYDRGATTLLSTPLYSNTTLVSLFPTLALGGTAVLMKKFEAGAFLKLAEKVKATHSMLVPVQYQRLMDHPDFDKADLSSYQMKFCTSAPFPAALKAEVLRRWPGGLIEVYGMTEGGGATYLFCHKFPDKLHTVGRPAEGHEIRLLDEEGRVVAPGEVGEVYGYSPGLMNGYHNQNEKTREAFHVSEDGRVFMRTGDVGRLDEDGFLTLMDRKKDMIISGGFNIYPSDIEAVLMQHPGVKDAAVVGIASREWGETPVAFVTPRDATLSEDALRQWVNGRVGKTQRLHAVRFLDTLPRSAIGKVLKRELRDGYADA